MKADVIMLSIPAKTQYMVTARLVASSVGGRMGMDIDKIEDIKTAVTEACLLLLPFTSEQDDVSLKFTAEEEKLVIRISVPKRNTKVEADVEREFSVHLLEAMVDSAEQIEGEETSTYLLETRL